MGLFGREDVPASDNDTIEPAPPADTDAEKQAPEHDEGVAQGISDTTATADPKVEARLLRKLDLRVPTLMAFLCKLVLREGSLELI